MAAHGAGKHCRPGAVVFVIGTFTGRQLTVRSLRKARDGEYAHADLHDGPARDLDQMERDLRELLSTIQNPHLRGLLSAVFAESWSATGTRRRASATTTPTATACSSTR